MLPVSETHENVFQPRATVKGNCSSVLLLKIKLFFYRDGTMTPLFFILGVLEGS